MDKKIPRLQLSFILQSFPATLISSSSSVSSFSSSLCRTWLSSKGTWPSSVTRFFPTLRDHRHHCHHCHHLSHLISCSASRSQPPPNNNPKPKRDLDLSTAKLRLLDLCATTNRGQKASSIQKQKVDQLVKFLENTPGVPEGATAETEAVTGKFDNDVDNHVISLLDGCWKLVYSSGVFYTTSPFLFPAFTPLLEIGQIIQVINAKKMTLINQTEVTAFPLINGSIITRANISFDEAEGPYFMTLAVRNTSLCAKNFADTVDLTRARIDVPMQEIYQVIAQGTLPQSFLRTTYLDENLRVSRTVGDKFFIFTKDSIG